MLDDLRNRPQLRTVSGLRVVAVALVARRRPERRRTLNWRLQRVGSHVTCDGTLGTPYLPNAISTVLYTVTQTEQDAIRCTTARMMIPN